ncbi:MAG: D-alanyl-D-alanine carboxypeptidase family protein [Thermodesulfovibrio sp.]|nr:D-alanyl-D-alanine carboxypeptidase [Thermodesulfovibrio sp.]MDW7999111.1 D-alanyl-D-alanine carboxypeptidase family protein [Thermodesulfovibrio sp.]
MKAGYSNRLKHLTFKGIFLIFFVFLISILFYLNESLAQEIKKQNNIDAPTAVVVDSQTGKILYGKNPHIKLPPASTVKLVTAMVALEKLDPEERVTISKNAAKTQSVSPKLMEGEVYRVRDLIYLALMRSVNSAAVALAEATAGSEKNFVKLMNEKVQKIGAKDTKFVNASGLPGSGQYTTVYDLTKIMSHAIAYPLIKEAVHTRIYLVRSEDGKEHFIQNTNQLLWEEDNMIGGKTGYTRKAKHCFVSAYKINGRLVYTAILGDTNRERLWKDTQQLIERAEYVLAGKEEPVVKLSEEKPVMPVSYKKSQKLNKKNMVDKKKLRKNSKNKRIIYAKNNKKTI